MDIKNNKTKNNQNKRSSMRQKKNPKKSTLIVGMCIASMLVWSFPVSCLAMIPVVDAGAIMNLIKEYQQLKAQYDVLQQTYRNAQQQLDQAKKLTKDAEGHYGIGNFMNSAADWKARQWSPDRWQDALKGLSGGNSARYQELLKAYPHDHPTLSDVDYKKGASDYQLSVYSQDVQVNRAAHVNATYAFDDIKTHVGTLQALSQKIDQTPNTKAATDLNARLLTEVAYLQTEELKMQILLNQQLAQANADRIAGKTASAKFNTLPDE